MRCSRCEMENPPGASFCGRCAAPLPSGDAPAGTSMTLRLSIRELTTGTTFARRYQVIEELGHGGMGRVYKVFDTEVREKLALKLLHPEIAADAETIERFRSELRLARGVSHRHVCRMHDLGREEETGTYFITMEYVPGEDLKSLIHRIGALPVGKAVAIARQAAEGLAEAHRLGVVHRDLKPQNIMIDRDGGARIMDFGIARSARSRGLTGQGVIVGTPEYMSPEQVDGKEADARSDVYAMGAVLFEMLTGRLPFAGDTPLSVAVQQKTLPAPDPRTFNPQIPEELAKIVATCLAKPPAERYADAGALLQDLVRIESALPATTAALPLARPATSRQITVRMPSKKVWIPAASLLLLAAAIIVWQLVPGGEKARRTVAVLGFQNQTGDPGLDYLRETIPNLLITSLEQSKHLRVASWQRLKDLLRQEDGGSDSVFDEEAGFAACRRAGIEAVVVGFYSRAGETFVSDVKVLDSATREVLKSVSARGEGLDSILRSHIDTISRGVARGIGRPPLKIESPLPKIADMTTGSLEAYNLFLRGRDAVGNMMSNEAKKDLEKAVSLDPSFAIAYLYLAQSYYQLGDFRARDEALRKALSHTDGISEKESLYIQAQYASVIENNSGKKRALLIKLTERYPGEKHAFYELGSQAYAQNRFTEAVSALEKAAALDPQFGPALNMLGYSLSKSGRFQEAESVFLRYIASHPGDPNPLDSLTELHLTQGKLDQAEARYLEVIRKASPDFTGSYKGLAYISALREDYIQSARWIGEFAARASPAEKMEALWHVSLYDYFLGRLEKSLAGYLALKKIAESYRQEYVAASVNWILVFIYGDLGRFDEAEGSIRALASYYEKDPSRESNTSRARKEFLLGWIRLKQGRREEAREHLAILRASVAGISKESQKKEEREDSSLLLEAELALDGGTVEEAVTAAGRWQPGRFPGMDTEKLSLYNIPFLKDLGARALVRKGDLAGAAAEYRGLMAFGSGNLKLALIPPLYHYRLGRILEDLGRRAEAAAEYRLFVELWKEADSLFPEPADTRKRLAAITK